MMRNRMHSNVSNGYCALFSILRVWHRRLISNITIRLNDLLPGLRRIAFHFLPCKLSLRAVIHDVESNHHLYWNVQIDSFWRKKMIAQCSKENILWSNTRSTSNRNFSLGINRSVSICWFLFAYHRYHRLWTEILSYPRVIGQQIDVWHLWIPEVISNRNYLCRRFERRDSWKMAAGR